MNALQTHHEQPHATRRCHLSIRRNRGTSPDAGAKARRGIHLPFDGEWVWVDSDTLLEAGLGLLALGMILVLLILAR